MIITNEMLQRFNACKAELDVFAGEFPDGLDISGLWGDADLRQNTWMTIFSSPVCRKNLGWAIYVGLIPARITANLTEANLRWADLSRANLTDADLTDADLTGADLTEANLRWTKGLKP